MKGKKIFFVDDSNDSDMNFGTLASGIITGNDIKEREWIVDNGKYFVPYEEAFEDSLLTIKFR